MNIELRFTPQLLQTLGLESEGDFETALGMIEQIVYEAYDFDEKQAMKEAEFSWSLLEGVWLMQKSYKMQQERPMQK